MYHILDLKDNYIEISKTKHVNMTNINTKITPLNYYYGESRHVYFNIIRIGILALYFRI